MSEAVADPQDGPWDRRARAARRAMPYFLAVVSAALGAGTVASGYRTWSEYRLSLLLVGVAVLGQVLWDVFGREPGRHRLIDAAWFVIRFGLTAVLVGLNPWYGLFAFLGYLEGPRLLPRAAGPIGVFGTACVMAGSQLGGYPQWALLDVSVYLGVVGMNAVLAGGFAFISYRLEEQSERRQEAINELTKTNRRLETALRENAGLHAQLLVQAREAGTLDERARMAREIHDTLAQGLAGIVTQIQATKQAGQDSAQGTRHLDLAERLARDSLAEARRSVYAMRPQALDNSGLPEALTAVAQDWSVLHGVAVQVTTTGTPRPMHPEVELTLLRVAQATPHLVTDS